MKKSIITSYMKYLILFISVLLFYSCGAGSNKQSVETEEIVTEVSVEEEYNTTFQKSNNPADSVWINALNKIKLPETIEQDNLINVYFKYNQIVNGYEVTARWMPFDKNSETGYLVMNFRNTKNGQSFQYFETEKYNNFDTDNITFSDGFKGYHNGDIYYFDYLLSESDKGLGYYSPFQFLDVDFDGEKELLINGWCQSRGGNSYRAFKIKGNTIQLIEYPPFNTLQSDNEFDFRNKSIIVNAYNTAFNAVRIVYRLNPDNKIADKVYPKTLLDVDGLGRYYLEAYYNAPTGKFRLDSIYEYSETAEGAFEYIYANKNGKITLVGKQPLEKE